MKRLSFAAFASLLSAGAASAQDGPPQAAIDTCLRHAQAYSGVAGTFNGDAQADVPWFGPGAGNYWRLRIDGGVGGVAVSCTVSADGKRVAIEPLEG